MRRLETHDVFNFARLINKIGAKEALKNVVLEKNTIEEMTTESFGYDVLFTLMDVATTESAENEIYDFLAPLFEKTTDEMKHMDPLVLMYGLKDIANWEEWKNFFTLALKSTKPNSSTSS